MLSETFTQDFIPTKIEKQIQVENTVAVKLKFDRQAAFRVYDEFTDNITEDSQGNLYVQIDLPDNEVLYSYVMSLGTSMEENHDFGYGLRKEFWHMGIVAEAGKAVIEQVKKDGLPYITATHDRNNPRSGNVMQKLGMTYCYSYEEQWQPKDIPVIFRMYQLNFDGDDNFVYKKYWNRYSNHFVEKL